MQVCHFYYSNISKMRFQDEDEPCFCVIDGVEMEYTEALRAPDDGSVPMPTSRWADIRYLGKGYISRVG